MRRRAVIHGACSVALARPLDALAQPATMPVVGYIGALSRHEGRRFADAFQRGLAQFGFVDGRTVAIEYRWADGRYDRIPEVAAELVRRRVNVICTANNAGALAAKAATSDIPIVFVVGLDPVQMGLVSAFNRPGGNATGISFMASALEPKRLEVLRDLLPGLQRVAALVNPDNANAADHVGDLQAAARKLAMQLQVLSVRNAADIETAFVSLKPQRADAIVVTIDPFFLLQRERLADLAARHALPAIYPLRDFVEAGGLLSYGNDLTDATRLIGVLAGRILRGAKPADLPVQQPTAFELVINLKAVKALGLTIPPAILAQADEVIE
ncbi:MAG: ABC transporter substrate-binding protein [Alphaproteobacteria bacterium]|nr:ABC transporter substrate-binding protein [Alphaproteobacteria bacterium]